MIQRTSSFRTAFAALGLAFGTGSAAQAQTLTTTRAASGLVRPIWLTSIAGDFARVFVIEKQGRIRVIKNGALLPTSFLDIDPIITGGTDSGSEQGLLGLTFDPNYATNGYFYVNYTAVAGAGDTVVARYQVSANPDLANPASAMTVLTFNQPQSNHNGGWIGFGPDGFLYIATGDGGSGGDSGTGHTEPGGNAQDITTNLLGKMLRVDIRGDDFPADSARNYRVPSSNPFVGVSGDDEIWAYGLRNPWRSSFDRRTGDLWIADVGQSTREEINFQPPSVSGRNYGWRCMEGTFCTGANGCICNSSSLTLPIKEYDHTLGCSITGGYVYRGCAIPALSGTYFYADYCAETIWSLKYNGTSVTDFTNRTSELAPGSGLSISTITSFGEDAYGELYICDQDGGEVFKIVPRTLGTDCNSNGIADACEIANGTAIDRNNDGILDLCKCPADFSGDGFVTGEDFDGFVAAFVLGNTASDYNGDGFVTGDDFDGYVVSFQAGC